MSVLTTNLQLVKPETTDSITPTIFANNFDAIDKAVGCWIGTQTIPSGATTFAVENELIKYASLVDVYYSEGSKETAIKADPSYVQTAGVLTINFQSPLTKSVTIDNIKVVNL